MRQDRLNFVRAVMRWVMAAFYVAAGIAHLVVPDKLLAITPSWVPFAPQVVFVTGLCELAGAVALVTSPWRRWAGFALVWIGLAVFSVESIWHRRKSHRLLAASQPAAAPPAALCK